MSTPAGNTEAAPKESGDGHSSMAHPETLADEGVQSIPAISHGGTMPSEDAKGSEYSASEAGSVQPANVRRDGKRPLEELTGKHKRKALYKVKKNQKRMADEKAERAAARAAAGAQDTEGVEDITEPSSSTSHPSLPTNSDIGNGATGDAGSNREGEGIGKGAGPQSLPNFNQDNPPNEPESRPSPDVDQNNITKESKPQSLPKANRDDLGKEPESQPPPIADESNFGEKPEPRSTTVVNQGELRKEPGPQSPRDINQDNSGSAAARSCVSQPLSGQNSFQHPAPWRPYGGGGQRGGHGNTEERDGQRNGRGGQRGRGGYSGGRGGSWNGRGGQRGRGGNPEGRGGQWNGGRGRGGRNLV